MKSRIEFLASIQNNAKFLPDVSEGANRAREELERQRKALNEKKNG